MATPASDFLMKKHFTTENFTLLQKTLLYYIKTIFSTKLVSI